MHKGFFLRILFSALIVGVSCGHMLSQSITYELIGVYSSTTNTPDTLKFTPYLPTGFSFCHWSFDVTPEELGENTFVITPSGQTIEVTMNYVAAGGSCSDPDQLLTLTRAIEPKQALFTVGFDPELEHLATLKRVLRSAYEIDFNDFAQLGDKRFFWTFDSKMIPPPEVDFDPNDLEQGQYPNVYYTFPNGGNYSIILRVIDINTSLDSARFKMIIELEPVFEADKIDFPILPNAITQASPFEVVASGTTQLSFKVFTRSGALVYEKQANVISWDGKNYYGNQLPDGIYYYILEDIGEKKYNPAKGFFYIFGSK